MLHWHCFRCLKLCCRVMCSNYCRLENVSCWLWQLKFARFENIWLCPMLVLIWHSSMFVCLEMHVFITSDKGTRHVVSRVLMFACLWTELCIMHSIELWILGGLWTTDRKRMDYICGLTCLRIGSQSAVLDFCYCVLNVDHRNHIARAAHSGAM